jgi:predicted phosphodiesterase
MRLAIIADVHGNLVALEAVLADLRSHAPDGIVNLGDCVTSPLWPRETFELLETLAAPTVRGNHDRWIATKPPAGMPPTERHAHDALTPAQRAALGELPATIALDGGILAVHGTPDSDTDYLLEEAVEGRLALASADLVAHRLGATTAGLVLCGHSHNQHAAGGPRGTLIVNPGSVGCPRYVDNARWPAAEAGSPHARYAIVTGEGHRWSVQLMALEYDWSRAAARAVAQGRPDWAAMFLGSSG